LVDTNSKKVLGFTSREFYIISRTPDGTETKLYSGTWQNQSEYAASLTAASATTTPAATGSTGPVTQVTTTSVAATGPSVTAATGSATTTAGLQAINNVPKGPSTKPVKPYVIGSSSILSVKPTSSLNTTGGYSVKGPNKVPVQSSTQVNNINITALADSISGKEAQGLTVQNVVNFYFTPGAPGANLFKGLKASQFLTAAYEIHPKLPNGSFDTKYIQYCNALDFPVSSDPEGEVKKNKAKK
jgi:hypothetical protein